MFHRVKNSPKIEGIETLTKLTVHTIKVKNSPKIEGIETRI